MKQYRFFYVIFAGVLTLICSSIPVLQAEQEIPGRYIIVFQDLVRWPIVKAHQLANRHTLVLGHVYEHALKGCVASIPDSKLQEIQNDPDVKYMTPDHIVTLVEPDPYHERIIGQPGSRSSGSTQPTQVIPTGVNRVNAELSTVAVIDGIDQRVDIDVAVIDTGIDKKHPDLNVVGGVNFSTGKITNFNDGNGHGTHVSGTVAALDNSIGVVGVAPGARLWGVRVLDNSGSGFLSDVIAGIDWVTQRADIIDVANMSLGWTESSGSSAAHDAIRNSVARGVVYVVAAGNSSKDAIGFAPASYDEVITVSAIADSDGGGGGLGPLTTYGADDTFASFSNFGSVVDLAAPGVNIFSTLPNGFYGKKSGTSMASPHVAGAAALYVKLFGKPLDSFGVSAVRQGLIQFGFSQGSFDGFRGDPDLFPEPLVNAQF